MLTAPETIPLTYGPKPVFTKLGARYRKLSQNSAEWGRQIQDALYNEQPQLNDKKINIHWESKDDTQGNAVGRLVVEGKIAIPIIVDNFKLAPLDTYTDQNVKPHRINPKRLKQALFNPDMFDGIISPQDERGLMPDIPLYRSYGVLPWEEGRRVYASLLDQVLPYATQDSLEKFAAALNSDPQISVNFHAHGMADIISKVLHTRPEPFEKIADDLLERLPVSVVQIRANGNLEFLMKMASDGLYAPQEIVIPADQIQDRLQRLGVDDVHAGIQKAAEPEGLTVTLRRMNAAPVFDTEVADVGHVEKFGSYQVKDINGRDRKGYVFPRFHQFDKKAMDRALFIGDGFAVMQPKIAGIRDAVGSSQELPSALPNSGDTGVFVFEAANPEGGYHAAALEPVKIACVEFEPEGAIVEGQNLMGERVRLCVSKVATDLIELDEASKTHRTFLLPESAKFVKLNGLMAEEILMSQPAMLKEAAQGGALGPNQCQVSSPLGGRLYTLTGPLAELMECSGQEQYPDEAIFKLACMGLSAEDAQGVLKTARERGSVTVGGLRELKSGKVALGHTKRAEKIQALSVLPKVQQDVRELIKVAADIQDPASVDRVLALNFLNPQNIGILVDHMNDLEDTGTRLSEMLIATRMGARSDLNESAIIQARQSIDDVLDGLANLRSRLGPQTATEETGGSVE